MLYSASERERERERERRIALMLIRTEEWAIKAIKGGLMNVLVRRYLFSLMWVKIGLWVLEC